MYVIFNVFIDSFQFEKYLCNWKKWIKIIIIIIIIIILTPPTPHPWDFIFTKTVFLITVFYFLFPKINEKIICEKLHLHQQRQQQRQQQQQQQQQQQHCFEELFEEFLFHFSEEMSDIYVFSVHGRQLHLGIVHKWRQANLDNFLPPSSSPVLLLKPYYCCHKFFDPLLHSKTVT